MDEEWRDIEGFEDYQVSNRGRVANVLAMRVLKPYRDSYNYQRVTLSRDGKHYMKYVHRLVAGAFWRGVCDSDVITHLNGDRTDNTLENLTIMTGWAERLKGEHQKPSSPIMIVETGEIFESSRLCAKHLGTKTAQVNRALNGDIASHRGFHFIYCTPTDAEKTQFYKGL